MKKGKNKAPYKIWYGHTPNVSYLKIFESRCYIQKDTRNGKFNVKGDEGIFLGYSSKSKAYKYLKKSTNKMIESENVRFDELIEKNYVENKKEFENYNKFLYVYEEAPDTLPKLQQRSIVHQSMTLEL